jgi:hypothetical protein
VATSISSPTGGRAVGNRRDIAAQAWRGREFDYALRRAQLA